MEIKERGRLPVAVLGGGLTGLGAAWRLQRHGVAAIVLEAGPRAGGVIGAKREGGWLHEGGPNTLMENSAEVATMIDELGLKERRLLAAPMAKKRYVVHGGKLVALPHSKLSFFTSSLFSWGSKLGMLGEPWREKVSSDREESIAEMATRRLGAEILQYAVEPFVAGVYAGDARRLSVRLAFPKLYKMEQEHGSLIRAALHQRQQGGTKRGGLISFPDGLEEIPRALAQALGPAVRCGSPVAAVRKAKDFWEVRLQNAVDWLPEKFSAVICALPPDALAGVNFEGMAGAERLRELREIEQPPVASVFLGFRREQVAQALDGFGFLAPPVEKRRILGTLFSSTLFPGRAPEGQVALTTFVGGARQPELARLDEKELVELVKQELAQLLGAKGEPTYVSVQRWPRAIPQYNLGYQRFLDICAGVEKAASGLFIGGNCRDGISLPQCIEAGRRLAEAAGKQV